PSRWILTIPRPSACDPSADGLTMLCMTIPVASNPQIVSEMLQACWQNYDEGHTLRSLDELSPLELKARWVESRSEIR
ncbi:MAG: hypothetical protein OXI24_06910, partial [Candidatus Poribacteria bacterium]|nr:hypothetical protein [Candidatus Poribacteria bacterium]